MPSEVVEAAGSSMLAMKRPKTRLGDETVSDVDSWKLEVGGVRLNIPLEAEGS